MDSMDEQASYLNKLKQTQGDVKKTQPTAVQLARVNKSIQYLKTCKDPTTNEAFQHISTLYENTLPKTDPGGIICKYIGGSGIGYVIPQILAALLAYVNGDLGARSGVDPWVLMNRMLNVSANAANESAECGVAIAKSGGIKVLFEGLEKIKETNAGVNAKMRILCILHGAIRLCPGNVPYYRSYNAVTILKRYLERYDKAHHLKSMLEHCFSLMILAYITTDLEKKELASSAERGVRLLIETLKVSASSPNHLAKVASNNFSAFETLDAINKLANNDEVKNAIADQDGIPAIVKMLQDDFSPEEQRVAAETIWNLAFIDSIRQSDTLQNTIPTLQKLIRSKDQEVSRASMSALFVIQGNTTFDPVTPSMTTPSAPPWNTPSAPPPSYQEAISDQALTTSTDGPVQIMISYQWDSQERAKKIRDNLAAVGYKIWMDITPLKGQGDTLQAMAEAVEESDVILLCATEKYRDSQSCRSEASYAYNKKKKIIPLLLEKDYKPDGWVGVLQSTTPYYSFYSEEQMDKNMGDLVKVLEEHTRPDGGETDGLTRSTNQEAQGAIPKASAWKQSNPAATGWSKEDVQRWLRDNDLTELCEKFRRFGGRHLKMKYDDFCKDDAKFKSDMKSDYGMDDAVYTDFVVNLQDAFDV